MIKINPRKIFGNWFEGYALDVHTISSEFLGYDEFGHQVFDTKRSEMGELLYNLKYKQDIKVIHDIVEVTVNFINNNFKDTINGIIPVPPSLTHRKLQPVIEVAREISNKLGIPLYENILLKSKENRELKNVFDYHERLEILKDNFIIDNEIVRAKQILLFDDLFRSGATMTAATDALYKQGNVEKVYVLTLTRTRKLS